MEISQTIFLKVIKLTKCLFHSFLTRFLCHYPNPPLIVSIIPFNSFYLTLLFPLIQSNANIFSYVWSCDCDLSNLFIWWEWRGQFWGNLNIQFVVNVHTFNSFHTFNFLPSICVCLCVCLSVCTHVYMCLNLERFKNSDVTASIFPESSQLYNVRLYIY